ncbi:MAG: cell division protein FtsA [Parvibaculales bacterium]
MIASHKRKIITSLDIGASQTRCFIAELQKSPPVKILGCGWAPTKGIQKAGFVNMDELEDSIRKAVELAEKNALQRVQNLYVGVNLTHMHSRQTKLKMHLNGEATSYDKLRRMLNQGCKELSANDTQLLHAMPVQYSIDDRNCEEPPIGVCGYTLAAMLHTLHIPQYEVQSLTQCFHSAHLEPLRFIATPYASAIASLNADECKIGAVCLDIGAQSTAISIFYNELLQFAKAAPIGGENITMDIAQCFSISPEAAEKVKLRYGAAHLKPEHRHQEFEVPHIAEEGRVQKINCEKLNRVIIARMEDIFENVRNILTQTGLNPAIINRIVLTGGSAEMEGIEELAANMLQAKTRTARPPQQPGQPETASSPAFSASIGMLLYAWKSRFDDAYGYGEEQSFAKRIKNWIFQHD